jgi:hypothetical protein
MATIEDIGERRLRQIKGGASAMPYSGEKLLCEAMGVAVNVIRARLHEVAPDDPWYPQLVEFARQVGSIA